MALSPAHLDASTATSFYDLGMGLGKFALLAFLSYPNLKKVVGVELAESRSFEKEKRDGSERKKESQTEKREEREERRERREKREKRRERRERKQKMNDLVIRYLLAVKALTLLAAHNPTLFRFERAGPDVARLTMCEGKEEGKEEGAKLEGTAEKTAERFLEIRRQNLYDCEDCLGPNGGDIVICEVLFWFFLSASLLLLLLFLCALFSPLSVFSLALPLFLSFFLSLSLLLSYR